MTLRTILTTIFLVFGFSAYADEPITSPPMFLEGGLICDTLEQAVHNIENPETFSEGCGLLAKPIVGTVTILGVFDHNGLRFHLARYEFVGDNGFNPIQYGFWGVPTPVEPVNVGVRA